MLIGPLALLVLLRGRKRGKRKLDRIVLLLALALLLTTGVVACEKPPIPEPTKPVPPTSTEPPTQPPTKTDRPKDTPTPTATGYDRAKAKLYAINHYKSPNTEVYFDFEAPDVKGWSDCANFVSQALYDGGLRDTREQDVTPLSYWGQETATRDKVQALINKGSKELDEIGSWVDAGDLFSFLLGYGHATYVFGGGGFFQPPMITNENEYAPNPGWENKLAENRAKIQEGDVVFYSYGVGWKHAALVVGWGEQTFYTSGGTPTPTSTPTPTETGTSCPSYPEKPRILDRGSALSDRVLHQEPWGRSLDNVTTQPSYIEILHISS